MITSARADAGTSVVATIPASSNLRHQFFPTMFMLNPAVIAFTRNELASRRSGFVSLPRFHPPAVRVRTNEIPLKAHPLLQYDGPKLSLSELLHRVLSLYRLNDR